MDLDYTGDEVIACEKGENSSEGHNFIMRTNPVRQSGFSLIELMVTAVIAVVLVGFAVPSFQGMIMGGALTVGANDFVSGLQLARSEAVKRGGRVTVCKSSSTTVLAPSCDGSTWGDGWIIFDDLDSSGTFDAGEDLIRIHEPLKYGFTVNADAILSDRVSFNSMGSSTGLNNTFASGSITLSYAAESREISIMSSGRARVK